MEITDILTLLGGVALFLFGMSLMGDGLKKVAGNKLEVVLYRLTSTPIKGVLLGTGVTAVIQSSSATSVMVVGFVNAGMMQLMQAMGVILGSILGTSITGWVLSLSAISGGGGWVSLLSTETLTAVVAIIGIILRMFSKSQVKQHVGDILMGFAVLMFGMHAMSGAVAPLKSDPNFINLLTRFSNPILGILAGLLITMVLQSASAAVGILQALAMTGTITFDVAFPLIVGIAVGAAVPVLLSSIGASTDGRRSAWFYLATGIFGVLVAIVFYILNGIFDFSFMSRTETTVSIALVNTIFRAVKVLLLMPLLKPVEKLLRVIIPDRPEDQDADQEAFDRLEERFLAYPPLAIEQSRLTVDAMAARTRENLFDAFKLLDEYTDKGFQYVEKLEDTVDKFEDRIGTYLIKITNSGLNPRQSADVSKYLHMISDLERISDHALNVAETAQEMHEKQIHFSEQGQREMTVMVSAVTEIVNLSFGAFLANDLPTAYRVEPLEETIDNLCDEMKLHHVERLQAGTCTLHHGFAFNDLLTNLERVADHCSNIAVALIELESEAFDVHEYVNSVMAMHSNHFDEYFAEYSKKYAI